jgi:hypothetical protein
MTDKKTPSTDQDPDAQLPVGPTDDDNDTEGHSQFLNPGSSYDMAKARNREIERHAREHARQKEARAKSK